MKKIITLCMGLIAVLAVQAQSDFPLQFADKDGNIIADGTMLTLSDAEVDDFGDVEVASGLYVKNTTDADVQAAGKYTIQSIGSGVFQTCFPSTCIQKNSRGDYETQNGNIEANALKDMQTEWLPTTEGTCVVTYQLETYKQNPVTKKWDLDKQGPTVTLNFSYSTTGIGRVTTGSDIRTVEYYDLQGRRVSQPAHGLFVKKTINTDGTYTITKINQ